MRPLLFLGRQSPPPMLASLDMLRREPRARAFFAAHAQSSIGTGAGYVALLLVAYDRFRSPWAITLVLLADFLPPMLLAPLCGAAADRWDRRTCAVAADLLRAVAFIAIALVGDMATTIALALLAGAGTALFRPVVLAALPQLTSDERSSSATALYGALENLGFTAGPLLAAIGLLVAGPETLLLVNGVTFAASALLLTRVRFAEVEGRGARASESSFLAEARAGLTVAGRLPGVRAVILSSSAVVLFAGLFNVGELLLATDVMGAGPTGYSALVAVFGLGVVAGSLAGSRSDGIHEIGRRFSAGLLVVAIGMLATGLVPSFSVALVTFAVSGVGNGLVVTHERLLLQRLAADRVRGRVFGLADGLASWAFGAAFLAAAALASMAGTRMLFVLAGAGGLLVWGAASIALARALPGEARRSPVPAGARALAGS